MQEIPIIIHLTDTGKPDPELLQKMLLEEVEQKLIRAGVRGQITPHEGMVILEVPDLEFVRCEVLQALERRSWKPLVESIEWEDAAGQNHRIYPE